MADFNKFQDFVEQLGKGVHQLHAAGHTLKVFLTNEAPVTTDTVKTDMAEITAEHGYNAGGEDTQNDFAESGGTGSCTGTDITWTASGGTIGPFRYAVLYNDDASDRLIGWWDYGSAITLNAGESFKTDFGASMFTLA
ncbi:MAG: hypothetical protein WC485_00960 [Opitutaceae bacterium]